MEPLASKEEVAEILGVEPRTLDNWASLGKGPVYVKVGGLKKYDLADVRQWVEARKVTPAPHASVAEARRNMEELRAKGLVDYDTETDRYWINALGRRVLDTAGGGNG